MSVLKTPVYNLNKFPNVYEPSEDTFLFLDSLEIEIDYLCRLKPSLCVEIGSGSGVVITALAKIVDDNCACFATDINEEAVQATHLTSTLNNVKVDCLEMNLLDKFKSNLFDVILFNPPYVVTDQNEVVGNGLNRAWAGGHNGREIIDKVLVNLSSLLSPEGVCYMIILKENKPEEIIKDMLTRGFTTYVVKERKILGEHLFVLKFVKNVNDM